MSTDFWKDRKVLVTGHTGFKGSWLSLWLQRKGARLTGFALPPPTRPGLFELAGVAAGMDSVLGDVRDAAAVDAVLRTAEPEVVIHLAAKPLVRYAYENPAETYATNVMGTVHVLDAVRRTPSVRAVVVVTSDKCYENREWLWPYREDEPMGGRDPYASSKGCAELVAAAMRASYFTAGAEGGRPVGIATARAGNVIGGGDWSPERLVPDVMAAILSKQPVALRCLTAVRPWQFVLEPLAGYLQLAEKLHAAPARFAGAWNFGPPEESNQPVASVAERIVELWGGDTPWIPDPRRKPHEDMFLKLDSSKARSLLDWRSKLSLDEAIRWIVAWYRAYVTEGESSVRRTTLEQVEQYEAR